MYNLFVTADCDAWEGKHTEFARSRCLAPTYTDADLSTKYRGLTDADCNFLLSLPCLFAYESSCEKNARVGWVTRVRTKADQVRIDFEIPAGTAELSPEQIFELTWDLGLGNWEMGHTHWALKKEDLATALGEVKLSGGPRTTTGLPLVDITRHVFDVGLSFPGEAREYVEAVALELVRILGPNRIFYDNLYKSQLARPNLDTLLQDIYGNRCRLIVVFLSKAYGDKRWCGIEFRPVREIISTKKDEAVMYVKTAEGNIPGVFATDGFIDAKTHTPNELALFITERLKVLSS